MNGLKTSIFWKIDPLWTRHQCNEINSKLVPGEMLTCWSWIWGQKPSKFSPRPRNEGKRPPECFLLIRSSGYIYTYTCFLYFFIILRVNQPAAHQQIHGHPILSPDRSKVTLGMPRGTQGRSKSVPGLNPWGPVREFRYRYILLILWSINSELYFFLR